MSTEKDIVTGFDIIDIPAEWDETPIQEPAPGTTPPAVIEPAPAPSVSSETKQFSNPYREITAIPASELITLELPRPDYLLFPWLRVGQSALISAKAGIGKTFIALTIAKCVASGDTMLDGRWYSPNAARVLYLDGEMASVDMQTRLKSLGLDTPNFLLVNQDFFPNAPAIELANPDCQKRIQELIRDNNVSLIVVDNIATLYHSGRSDSMEFWQVMQSFILDLRRKGIACLLIDHQGKTGDSGPRGTSAKSDILHSVISLTRPDDYTPSEGARFEVHFTKTRGFSGPDATPFEAWLHETDGRYCWDVAEIADRAPAIKQTKKETIKEETELVASLLSDGKTIEEITEITGRSQAVIYRRLAGYNPDGQLQPGEHPEFSQFGKDKPK